MLIASGDWDPINASMRTPTNNLGHGIVNLANVISEDPAIALQVIQNVKIGPNGHKMFTFQVPNPIPSAKLRIVMSYLDAPSVDWEIALVIDLDLYIKTPSGEIIFGNQHPGGQAEREERFSTSERILLFPNELTAGGTYELHVVANGNWDWIETDEYAFSLVLAGPIVYQSDFHPIDVPVVPCPEGKTGTLCEIDPGVVSIEARVFHIRASSYRYFRVSFPEGFSNLSFRANRRPSARSPIRFHFARDALPVAQSLYSYQVSMESDDIELFIPDDMLGGASFLGMMMTNVAARDFDCNLSIIADLQGPAVVTPSSSPRATSTPRDWYGGMVAASVVAAMLGVTAVILLVLLWRTKRTFDSLSTDQ
jgi:hypothetical protein